MAAAGGVLRQFSALAVAVACILCVPHIRDDTKTVASETVEATSLLQSGVSLSRLAEVPPTLQADGAAPTLAETTPEALAAIAGRKRAMLDALSAHSVGDVHAAAARQAILSDPDMLSLLAVDSLKIPDDAMPINLGADAEAAVTRLDESSELSSEVEPFMGQHDFKVTEGRLSISKKDRHKASKNAMNIGAIILGIALIVVLVPVSLGWIYVGAWTEKGERSSGGRSAEQTDRKIFFTGRSTTALAEEKQEKERLPAVKEEEEDEDDENDIFVGPATARSHNSEPKQKDVLKVGEKKHKRVRFVEE